MKEAEKNSIRNKIISIIIFLVLLSSILIILLLIIAKPICYNSHNNLLNKDRIKSNYLKSDSDAKVNSIFINISSNHSVKTKIYIGGSNLSATNGENSSLVTSVDKGKTWISEKYFETKDHSSTLKPEVSKIMTDFYTDENGTCDSIVITGKYLPSLPNSTNGMSLFSGQVAFERIYPVSKTIQKWSDISKKDGVQKTDSKNNITVSYDQTIISASTIKTEVMLNKSEVEQNHIYFISNDENININYIFDIPYHNNSHHPTAKFYKGDLVIKNSHTETTPTVIFTESKEMTGLNILLNPLSIYAKVISVGGKPATGAVSNFDPSSTSFLFKSDVKGDSENYENKLFIVENQHFYGTLDSKSISYDNPYIIEYDITTSKGTSYKINSGYIKYFNNFLIKTIAINPSTPYNNDKYDSNFLIFGGEKDNKSMMVSPILNKSDELPLNPPDFPDTPTTNSTKGSYIEQIISFPAVSDDINDKKLIPLVIIGSNMNTSNQNIALPDPINIQKKNSQNFTNQGLLLANIEIDSINKSTSVTYSQDTSFMSGSNVNLVQKSDNYSELNNPSMNDTKYTFELPVIQENNPVPNSFIELKITKNGDNSFIFKRVSNSIPKWERIVSINWITYILVPLIALIALLSTLLFIKLKWFRKKDSSSGQENSITDLSKHPDTDNYD